MINLPDPLLFIKSNNPLNIGRCKYKSQIDGILSIINKGNIDVPYSLKLKSDTLYYWSISNESGVFKPGETIDYNIKLNINKQILDDGEYIYDKEGNRLINLDIDVYNKVNGII